MPMMTQSEYAKHRGVSPVSVLEAVRAGRIKKDGKLIDSEQADRDWEKNSRARVSAKGNGGGESRPPPPPPAPEGESDSESPPDYFTERARREKAEADKAEMTAAIMRGTLAPVDKMRAEYAKRIAAVRDGLLALPARMGPALEQQSAQQIESALEAELRSIMSGFGAD